MLNIMPITTAIMSQFNDYISIVRFHPVVLYIMLCCNALVFYIIMFNIMLMRKLVPHFLPCWHDYHITKVLIKIIVYKSDDQHADKLTNNDF